MKTAQDLAEGLKILWKSGAKERRQGRLTRLAPGSRLSVTKRKTV
jgi:hypothetical protein